VQTPEVLGTARRGREFHIHADIIQMLKNLLQCHVHGSVGFQVDRQQRPQTGKPGPEPVGIQERFTAGDADGVMCAGKLLAPLVNQFTKVVQWQRLGNGAEFTGSGCRLDPADIVARVVGIAVTALQITFTQSDENLPATGKIPFPLNGGKDLADENRITHSSRPRRSRIPTRPRNRP